MKIGIVGDIHWSRYSSIVRLRGEKYSYRLENCIKSINWAEEITADCDKVVYLGDFFDSSELNSEELTALKELKWNDSPHLFLVGNHELGLNDLAYSSAHLFNFKGGKPTIDKPTYSCYGYTEICYLPYIVNNSGNIEDYLSKPDEGYKRIIFSHNDIAGVQLGKYISKSGFSIESIEDNCDLFINGHIHNGGQVTDKIINVGNLTGQNFGEDATLYDHHIFILDTDTLHISTYENPYAINFYKIDSTKQLWDVTKLKSNAVITLKCTEENQAYHRELLNSASNVIAYRFITIPKEGTQASTDSVKELLSVNHIDKFKEYILSTLGSSDIVLQELGEVSQ